MHILGEHTILWANMQFGQQLECMIQLPNRKFSQLGSDKFTASNHSDQYYERSRTLESYEMILMFSLLSSAFWKLFF